MSFLSASIKRNQVKGVEVFTVQQHRKSTSISDSSVTNDPNLAHRLIYVNVQIKRKRVKDYLCI